LCQFVSAIVLSAISDLFVYNDLEIRNIVL